MRFTMFIFVLMALFAVFANAEEKDCGVCILLYNPVCAEQNGVKRTFQHECHIPIANCQDDAKWVKISDVSCP